nr:hypothetical protein JVH1_5205 [Rhodococcus sp. JVH1]
MHHFSWIMPSERSIGKVFGWRAVLGSSGYLVAAYGDIDFRRSLG